jgi:HD-like signal output (HDOD) protein
MDLRHHHHSGHLNVTPNQHEAFMLFKGDLSKYHPVDAMAFLSQVGTDGLLTVADQDNMITLSFKSGQLVDAHSSLGDRKLLRHLQFQGRLENTQIRQIQEIQCETGLSVRNILGQLNVIPMADLQPDIQMSILEVLRQLFLLDHGSFNFTETPVEDDGVGIQLDVGRVTLTILPQADEYRDFIKTIRSAERKVQVNGSSTLREDETASQNIVLQLAKQQPSIHELIDKAPLPSHEVLGHLQALLAAKAISLQRANPALGSRAEPALDPMFSAYKQSLKALLHHHEVLPRLEALISFSKFYYDHILVLTAKQDEVIHCKVIQMQDGGLVQKSQKGHMGSITTEPVFTTVARSGIAFFGKAFPSELLKRFIGNTVEGECALIRVPAGPGISIYLYTLTTKTYAGVSPQHYMELLSWIASPTRNPDGKTEPPRVEGSNPETRSDDRSSLPAPADTGDPSQERIAKMVHRLNDLPPLPTLVSKALQLLSDPETPLEEIEAVIGKDQALVAKLIKVGNSALYGGLQKATTLRQVLARLGLKTTRNLVLAASTRSYFLSSRKGMRVWGQFLWQHSVESGLAARRIAETLHYADPEEAFIGGLVHDIGKLIILMLFPDPYKEILKLKKVQHLSSKASETQTIGCDHEHVGRILMDRWNMPDSAKACAEYHHRYQECDVYGDLAAMVAYADYLSRQYGSNPEPLLEQDHAYAQEIMATLRISPSIQETLAEAVVDDFENAEMLME